MKQISWGSKLTQSSHRLFSLLAITLLILGACAQERDVEPVPADKWRFPKKNLTESNHFHKSITDAQYGRLFTGLYLNSDETIRFKINETTLDVVYDSDAIQAHLFDPYSGSEANTTLASFPIKHVDVLRVQNDDNEDTHEEEVTEDRRPWWEREYIVIDPTQDKFAVEELSGKNLVKAEPDGGIDFDAERGAINFKVVKHLTDGSQVRVQYSFLQVKPSETYVQMPYKKSLQKHFGFFKTQAYKRDKYGQITDKSLKEYVNRWDTSKPVAYYLSSNFPTHLEEIAFKVFERWNAAFKKATGHDVLRLERNSGQAIGDLRYNMIHWETHPGSRLLGYGPSVVNRRTGEIIKGDVFLYGGSLKRALWTERMFLERNGGSPSASVAASYFNPSEMGNLPILGIMALSMDFSMPFDFKAIGNAYSVQPQDIQKFAKTKTNLATAFEHRAFGEAIYGDESLRMTFFTPDAMASIHAADKEGLRDEDLEKLMFGPLLAHELGHTLGFRHNFKGSVDSDHFDENEHSSSIMDYAARGVQEQPGPGPYDRAAVEVFYGHNKARVEELLAENFYFCTDEDTMTSRDPMCQTWDEGGTLVDTTLNQFLRYVANYEYLNRRQGRVFFSESGGSYFNSVVRYLLPLRYTFDHATSIVDHVESFSRSASGSATETRALVSLWRLLNQRIAAAPADYASPLVQAVTLRAGEERITHHIDIRKIQTAYAEAKTTQKLVFDALSMIVLGKLAVPGTKGKQERPNYSTVDPIYEEIQLRGVLQDKVVALLLMGMQTSDPLTGAIGTSLYEVMHEEASEVFASLLSNVVKTKDGMDLKFFNPSLRRLTLDLIDEDLARSGLKSAESRELMRLKQKTAMEHGMVMRLEKIREEKVNLIIELNVKTLNDTLTEEKEKRIEEEVKSLEDELESINFEAVDVGEYTLVTPLSLEDEGFNIPTATGRLIRHLVNKIEDNREVLMGVVVEFEKKMEAETDLMKKILMANKLNEFQDRILMMKRLVNMEKLFLLQLYKQYSEPE